MTGKKTLIGFILLSLIGLALAGITLYHSDKIAMLNPKGLIAFKERDLMGVAIGLMLLVVIPVFLLTFAIVWLYRADNHKATYAPDWDHSHLAEAVWWGFPLLIIAILSVITWRSSHELDPYKPLEGAGKPLTVQVVALQWKWLFIYPEQNVATVNYARIPEKVPIVFEVTADAPMNSFWLPQLGGQIYAMPGMKTTLNIIADEAGSYSGASANISGTGFAGMTFVVEATGQSDFDQWASAAGQAGSPLGLAEYRQLVKPSQYVPPATYALQKKDLFDWIVMQPMMPAEDEGMKSDEKAPPHV